MFRDPTLPFPHLSEISVYPLKGGGGFHPKSWRLDQGGLHLDRLWMVVDANGESITQRSNPKLALIGSRFGPSGVVLTAPGLGASAPLRDEGGTSEPGATLRMDGREEVSAVFVSTEVDTWVSEALGQECRLARFDGSGGGRRVDGRAGEGRTMNLQNAFPLHLVSEASLVDLNGRLRSPVRMSRFRPNLVIAGTAPHEEDAWKRVQVGETVLQVVRACDHRCGVPNIDQDTGARGVEPLRTLATYRRSNRGIYFGQNVLIERHGELRVADPVVVLETTAFYRPQQ